MTQKELEQKVIDAEGRVAKREAVLKKHNSQLTKMIEKGADRFDISIKREDSRARPPSWPRPARPSQTGRISSTPGSPATPTSRQTPRRL